MSAALAVTGPLMAHELVFMTPRGATITAYNRRARTPVHFEVWRLDVIVYGDSFDATAHGSEHCSAVWDHALQRWCI